MANKMDIFERRMVNINGDLRERVIYQRHMADDIFQEASGVIDEALLAVASGILAEDFVLAATANNVPNPHYIFALDTNIMPDASGARSIGVSASGWGYGYFDRLEIANTPVTGFDATHKDYVDSQIQGENHWDMIGAEIRPHLSYVDIMPNASGTQGIGSQTVPFNQGVFDSVVATNGWNGTFQTGDGRTATVTQGIITNVA
jgi:hypothetical protein